MAESRGTMNSEAHGRAYWRARNEGRDFGTKIAQAILIPAAIGAFVGGIFGLGVESSLDVLGLENDDFSLSDLVSVGAYALGGAGAGVAVQWGRSRGYINGTIDTAGNVINGDAPSRK